MQGGDRATTGRLANLLGALSLAVTDASRTAAEAVLGHAGETPAALVAIGHAPGLSNDSLARVLGRSHAGTVRVVDRLAGEGLLTREADERDRRAVSLRLTAQGEALRGEILAGRARAIAPVLDALSEAERDELERLLGKLLGAMVHQPLQALAICRLCDEGSCPDCPVDEAMLRLPGA